ncbi:MAG: nucleotidyltransferase domain-containing protein [Nanoarchaeota archaeon]
MPLKKSLREIKKDLENFREYEVVVYGSYAKRELTSRSDIDIAVITRKKRPEENTKIWRQMLGKAPQEYDVKMFELLPLEIKISLIGNYKVIYGDALEISEYFYHFRKLWKDVSKRYYENKISRVKEKLKLLRRARQAGF